MSTRSAASSPSTSKGSPVGDHLLQEGAVRKPGQRVVESEATRFRLGLAPRLDLVVHVADDQPHLEMVADDRREVFQLLALRRAEIVAWLHIEDADGADPMSARRDQRRARVEAELRVGNDERILGKARIRLRVLHDEDLVVEDGVRAEGGVAGRFAYRQVAARLEEIPVRIHEGDEPDRRIELAPRYRRDAVELRLRGGVEDSVFAQRLETLLLVHRVRRRSVHERLLLPLSREGQATLATITFSKLDKLHN